MSKGKAFEYTTAVSFCQYLRNNGGRAQIINDNNFKNVEKDFLALHPEEQLDLINAAVVGCREVYKLEAVLQNTSDVINISIAPDSFGIKGDVRDVILWNDNFEIGISCKHNHTALKHQRLSNKIDFGLIWARHPVSQNYWQSINPIFTMLSDFNKNKVNWKDLANYGVSKENDVYIPLLTHFLNEFNLLDRTYPDLAPKFMEYLVGRKDFYKFVMDERHRNLTVYAYNLHGNLGVGSGLVPTISLPTRFINNSWKVKNDGTTSNNTLIIEMDNNWTVALRLHSASSTVENSLKFDSQPISIPNNILTISNPY